MRRWLKKIWSWIGHAGDLSFLIATIGGFFALSALLTGVVLTLKAIPTALQLIACGGLIVLCAVTVPLALRRARHWLAGPELEFFEWRIRHRAEVDCEIEAATVSVRNALESGGERALARGVVLEVEVMTPAGEVVYRHVGWANYSERDFPATRVEERVVLAEKRGDDTNMAIGHCSPFAMTGQTYLEGRLTLRGPDLPDPPKVLFSLGLDQRGHLWVDGP